MVTEGQIDDLRRLGKVLTLSGNKTEFWDDSTYIWFILKGEVNLFAVPYEGNEVSGNRKFLLSVQQGQVIVGVENKKNLPFRLLMNGISETEIIRMEYDIFRELAAEKRELRLLINEWKSSLSNWMEQQDNNKSKEAKEYETPLFLEAVHSYLDESSKLEADRLNRLAKMDQGKMKKSIENLMGTMLMKEEKHLKVMDVEEDTFVRACQLLGVKTGISITSPITKNTNISDPESYVKLIAKASNVRIREVSLSEDWWRKDNGALLCIKKEDRSPVALIPSKLNRYELYDVTTKTVQRVTKDIEEELEQKAYMFYRPLPAKKLNLWDLVKYSSQTSNVRKDVVALLLLGILGGLLSLAIPVGLGHLVDTIIPGAERNKIVDFVLILGAIAIAIFTFEITRSLAMLRVEGRLDAHMQAAVWDRVLNLPVPFFRQFTSGDLAMRTSSISAIRQTLSGTTLTTIFTGLFSFTQFFLLFFYSPTLAGIASVLVLIVIGFTLLFGYMMVRNERELANLNGKLTGLVFQMMNGITKFRVSGAEKRAFGLWSEHFSATRKVSFKTGMIQNNFLMFNAIYPILATIVIFYSVWAVVPSMSTGSFLAFQAAFTSFIASMMNMSLSLISALSIIPLYERAKPILQTLPEIDEEKEEIGELTGEIEVNQVDFRYEEEGPLILKDVSLRIHSGEFIAIVGTSGSGKSTLMRLLLGFEKPTSGSIYYDNQNLDGLDIQSVRSKLGVVLQGGQLMSGDIFTNIVGSSNLTIEDAWEAARMAGLDEDIRSMPMGMFTVVDEGARTLSGGQRQRLLIARALVNKPEIIFFDEATSALDNQTQKVVSDSIEGLQSTRVVIAHRLSTIINADRIYVMDSGEIIEEGTFNELMEQHGIFSELAQRQMA